MPRPDASTICAHEKARPFEAVAEEAKLARSAARAVPRRALRWQHSRRAGQAGDRAPLSLFRRRRKPPVPPLLTVLMTTYDHEEFVEQALQSVVEQKTQFPFRLVVIEDCSNDRTRRVVESFASEHPGVVRLAANETNENSNRRFAAEWAACGSPYVALLDGDDYWTAEDKLQRQVALLESRPECSF